MSAVAVLIVLVAVAVLVTGHMQRSRQQRLRDELSRADRRIKAQHRQARRAMNDAAGHSWRNLVD